MNGKIKFVILLTVFLTCITTVVQAGEISGNSSQATEEEIIVFGNTYYGTITNNNEKDYYKIVLNEAGKVKFRINNYMEDLSVHIYDTSNKEVWKKTGIKGTYEECEVDLTAGTYYVRFNGYYCTGNYDFITQFISAKESFPESNNTLLTASDVILGQNVYGQIAENDQYDFYKVFLPESGEIQFFINNYMSDLSVHIYDTSNKEVWKKTGIKGTYEECEVDLTAGTYYIRFNGYYCTGNYDFLTQFTSAKESFPESNNTLLTASEATVGQNINGQIAANDEYDFYKYIITKSGKFQFRINNYMEDLSVHIYDTSNKEVWKKTGIKGTYEECEVDLTEGTYYVRLNGYYCTGNYQFCFETKDLKPTPTPFPQFLFGDLNYDGVVTANDALEILRAVVKLTVLNEEQTIAADVTGDAQVTAEDALMVLEKVVKITDLFPVER